jgi:hypothetical protein
LEAWYAAKPYTRACELSGIQRIVYTNIFGVNLDPRHMLRRLNISLHVVELVIRIQEARVEIRPEAQMVLNELLHIVHKKGFVLAIRLQQKSMINTWPAISNLLRSILHSLQSEGAARVRIHVQNTEDFGDSLSIEKELNELIENPVLDWQEALTGFAADSGLQRLWSSCRQHVAANINVWIGQEREGEIT